ncbi:hypothetical protein X975_11919, partial [Stegodyphus mimosarum]
MWQMKIEIREEDLYSFFTPSHKRVDAEYIRRIRFRVIRASESSVL